eukprot:CAMPEP_0118669600 /NCGR_PEP_ID=MMETSP0785-20121206/20993_1 /TAXON_ID=91992 /ORGANISM="Bolidomonas pacifica, Strain CCMP 1866" /LENGTH=147 /DNA_ID=CAMNT_0006564305 /DNA_START=451 /DNA_END=890 /DNA_ORIENTATION=-
MWNAYDEWISRLEVHSGLRDRLSPSVTPKSAVLPGGMLEYDRSSVVMGVEIRFQPKDGKIPFSIPALDKIERAAGQYVGAVKTEDGGEEWRYSSADVSPYLCNLFTAPDYRGVGLGRTLVRLAWYTATEVWGEKECYLHVDEGNVKA